MNEHQQQHYLAVVNYLKRALADGTLSVHQPIPSAAQLSQKLGFGETPVQEVLESLTTMGVLRDEGNEYFLNDDISATVADLICLMLLSNRFSYQNLSHLRRSFEKSALPLILENIEETTKNDLRSAILHMKLSENPNPKADSVFHRRMAAASGNALVACISDAISHAMELQITTIDEFDSENTWQELVSIHEDLLEGLCSGDKARADAALDAHYNLLDRQIGRLPQE